MELIYNSINYALVAYPAHHGYELVDKRAARCAFFQGVMADRFAEQMQSAIDDEASVEGLDTFLGLYDPLMTLPVVAH
jgi:hypothetical protein